MILEQWTGLEPASTGFEDQQLNRLAHHCKKNKIPQD